MVLKEIQQGGIVAWNYSENYNHLFATGSIQPDEQTQQHLLQIFKFDVMDKNLRPETVGSIQLTGPCKSLTWSQYGTEQGYKYGLIIIGMEDGSLQIINAQALLYDSQDNQNAVIYVEEGIFENQGPVECVQYNSLKPNLIAIGGEEVLIMDIQFENGNVSPFLFSPDENNNPHDKSTVTAVSWNQKISHILASVSQNGITVIWDLKSNKPIKTFGGDQSGQLKDVSLTWSPEYPTCFVKSEEEQNSKQQEVQVWDLRNPNGPVMILEKTEKGGHNNHISCISWCNTDKSLILTGSHDQSVICWSIKEKDVVCVEYFEEQIRSVNWSQINNLYSVTLQSGKVILKSLNNDETAIAPPKWYIPPIGARFSPNGDIAYFHEAQQKLFVKQRNNDGALDQFLDFDEFFEQLSNFENLSSVCDYKIQESKNSEYDTLVWQLLKGISASDKQALIQTLGFNCQDIQKIAETYTGKTHKKQIAQENNNQQQNNKKKQETTNITQIDDQSAFDFFDNLAQESTKIPEPERKATNSFQRLGSSTVDNKGEILQNETISRNINWDTGVEQIIKNNLIISNYEGAIDTAMKCGRSAEALLIAYSQGTEVFENTMKDYFVQNTDPFIKNVVRNIVKKNNNEIVSAYNLESWKECAAFFLSSVENQVEFKKLLDQLGDRFINEIQNENQAILCYILSQNFTKLNEIYYNRIQQYRFGSKQRKVEEVKYLEILIVLNQINNNVEEDNKQFNTMIYEAANYLYEDNLILASFSVLMEGCDKYQKINTLKDLIYQSHTLKLSPYYDQPAVPYTIKNIKQQIVKQNAVQKGQNRQFNNNNMNNNKPVFNQKPIGNTGNVPPPITKPVQNQNPFNNNQNNNNFNNNNNNNNNQGGLVPPPVKKPVAKPQNPFGCGGIPKVNNEVPPNFNNNQNQFNNQEPVQNQTFNQPNKPQKMAPPPVAKPEKKPVGGPKYVPPPIGKPNNMKPPGVNNFNNNNNNTNNLPPSTGNSHNNSFQQNQNQNQPPINNVAPPRAPVMNQPPVNNKPAINRPPGPGGMGGGPGLPPTKGIPPPPMRKN